MRISSPLRQSDPQAALYRIPHAEAYSGLSRSVIYNLINEGKLRKVNVGRAAFICGDSLRAFIADLRSGKAS